MTLLMRSGSSEKAAVCTFRFVRLSASVAGHEFRHEDPEAPWLAHSVVRRGRAGSRLSQSDFPRSAPYAR